MWMIETVRKKTEHADDEVNDNPCIHCIFEKELD